MYLRYNMEEKQKGNLEVFEFKNYSQASYSWDGNKPWVSWGEINNYPDYLIELYNRNAIHGSIVKGKGQYLYGKGLKATVDGTVLEQAKALAFLDKANRYESWNEIYAKTCRTFELFNGFAWQIIWNKGGTNFEVYHIDISKLRRSKCGKKVFYCEAWLLVDNNGSVYENPNPETHESFKEFPIFNPNSKKTSVYYFRLEVPSSMTYSDLYPTPDYSGCIMDIETLVEISIFHYNHMKNGLFASALVSLFNGEPSEEEKRKIKKMFDRTHIGSTNAGKVILNFVNEGGTPADIKTLTQSDLDKMFELVNKTLQQNIFTAHRVHPVLFGVMTEGTLGDTSGEAIVKKWEQFNRAYIEGRQEIITEQIEWMASLNGVEVEIEVEQTTPVGLDLPTDPTILGLFDRATLQKYYADKYGINVVNPALEAPETELSALPVNENIKNLTGAQYRRIQGYIAKYKAGKITFDEASHFIKGYGLGDDYISMVLGQKFSSVDRTNELVALFEKFAIDDDDNEILFEEEVKDEVGAIKAEFKAHKFATQKELENSVLDMVTGNPSITPEQIAKQMKVSIEEVTNALNTLTTNGLIVTQSGVTTVTEKGIKKDPAPVETEVYTVYKYVKRDGVPDLKGGSSRPFCQKMVALSVAGKRWTREAIENITNEFKEDAWTYRGGFYTNPNNKETTPFCRHIWKGVIKTRKKGSNNG